MAEFLIFVRNVSAPAGYSHWMDEPGKLEALNAKIDNDTSLTAAQKIKNKENLAYKYSMRSMAGDIIEVKPDGYYCEPNETTGHGWNHDCYALVKCPKITYEIALEHLRPFKDGNGKLVRKHRYSAAALGLSAGQSLTINTIKDLRDAIMDKAT